MSELSLADQKIMAKPKKSTKKQLEDFSVDVQKNLNDLLSNQLQKHMQ